MIRRCRLAAVHFAIVAMLLRALLPAGGMPDPGRAAGFVICTMNGSGLHTDGPLSGKPGPGNSRHSHDECPCAAAPHVAAPVLAAYLSAPALTGRLADTLDRPEVSSLPLSYQPHSPRAPPRLA